MVKALLQPTSLIMLPQLVPHVRLAELDSYYNNQDLA